MKKRIITKNNPQYKIFRRKLRQDQTEAERIIWNLLRNRQLLGLKFCRQYSLGKYILDFYCPKTKVCIEIDGGHHNETEKKEKDMERTSYLNSANIKVLRFWNNDVIQNKEGVYTKILDFITPSASPLS